jgi:DNA (cytosine-5)-methyltransferase 1
VRPPQIRASFGLPGELVVDCFAGAGGASTGIEAALGRPVDIAINHSAAAIALHKVNHPETRHYQEDIWAVDPREACGTRPVGLAWFSPDCCHFSRAKGNVPRSHGIRSLAWVVVKWARKVRPRVIVVENVEEFQTWGPLDDKGYPDPEKAGSTFRLWLNQLVGLGYSLDFRTLVAADYGTPTTRKRMFLVARRDGAGIAWPEPTHGQGRPLSWRPAAEVIDWSLPCPSIFDRARPLAEATLRRIAAGVRRFVIEAAEPFIVPMTHQGGDRGRGVASPLPTVTAAHRGELALCAPTLVTTGYGERDGQAPRVPGLDKPLGTVVAGGAKHALVAAFLARHFGGVVGRQMGLPVPTVTARDHHSLVAAYVTKFYGTSIGSDVAGPLPTVTGQGGHLGEVRAFLIKYYGTGGQQQGLFDPLHTVTSKARFGLVTIAGEQYEIADLGLRMLAPHELFAAQGFPGDYEIAPDFNGKPMTKTQQIALCGNAVCPQVAEAIVSSNTRGAEAAS